MLVKNLLKLLLVSSLTSYSLYGDSVKMSALACPSIALLTPSVDMDDSLELERYAIHNGCKVISKDTQVHVVDYAKNSKTIYVKIKLLQSGELLYTKQKNILIEQGGTKNIMRF